MKIILPVAAVIILGAIFQLSTYRDSEVYSRQDLRENLFPIQSIDTMKYSRDVAREKAKDLAFNSVIDAQIKLIADAGATHVAIGTPYDEEFIPFMKRWVTSARSHGLSVWFRGNFSGWEGWFSYPRVSPAEHRNLLKAFMNKHGDLFESGDIFTPCPECENGGQGDPRNTGDAAGFRKFLIDEFADAKNAFEELGKDVNLFASMNGDIARYVIDKKTAQSLGAGILIDHYVPSPAGFGEDIRDIREKLGVEIGLGEFGAPIPDINGSMTEAEQKKYVRALLWELYLQSSDVPAVNYWTLTGGSTELIRNGKPRDAYFTVMEFYRMPSLSGAIFDTDGKLLNGAVIEFSDGSHSVEADDHFYQIFIPPSQRKLVVKKEGYNSLDIELPSDFATSTIMDIRLEPNVKKHWFNI